MIREAMQNVGALNEAAEKVEILKLATDKSKNAQSTDELREKVASYFKIKTMPPKIKTTNVTKFVTEYNKLLKDSSYNKAMVEIFNFREDVGRGELLLACLADTIAIGGTSQPYDVDFGRDKIEVKEVNFNSQYMNNFRLGKESKASMKKALDDIKYLFSVAKYFYPDLNTTEFNDKMAEGQELTKIIKFLKEVDTKTLVGQEEVEIFLNKKGRVYFQGNEIGRLDDPNILNSLRALTGSARDLKKFSQIESELVKAISGKSIQYYFFEAKVGTLHYKKNLAGSTIDTITQGGIKFRVPYE